ncbi:MULTISPECIES: GNAT family N-acetyltransferase [unclassified Streptomyces]|uniref:GNAT family N-acetyltransferase n=1 Tax=unclassified Streptomyces TaxID=2593676 RepID=UPI00381CC031
MSNVGGRPVYEGASQRRAEGRHRRPRRRAGRWHRRLLAYRGVELLPSSAPEGAGEECLLLVHIRKVVGRVSYRACDECAEGVITEVVLDEPFRGCGLGTRALSHLRAQYPDVTWRTTLETRFTRDLLRRMRIPRTAAGGNCSH